MSLWHDEHGAIDISKYLALACVCGCAPCVCKWLRLVNENPPLHARMSEAERLRRELREI